MNAFNIDACNMDAFNADTVTAVLAHMNDDHAADSLVIARANGAPDATSSRMIGLDDLSGTWLVDGSEGEREIRVLWPNGPIAERAQIRREIVFVYRDACERLGIVPHGEAPATPFSRIIREGSWSDHEDSEGAGFMASIMRGEAQLADYTALVAQHFFMYEALEAIARETSHDPLFAPFYDPALERLDAIDADLRALTGADWREECELMPATAAYVARMREVHSLNDTAGVIAHHYTRYLGDLSGGQMIARRVSRQHGFERGSGVAFYDFSKLGALDTYKARYRAKLDRLGECLTPEGRAAFLTEVRGAYRFNTDVFTDLARARVPIG